MTQLTNHQSPRRGRLFPEHDPSPEEKAKLKAAQELLHKRGKLIFEKVRPQLIEEHYNWFIIIEPESGEYFIDQNQITALKKHEKNIQIEYSLHFVSMRQESVAEYDR